MQGARPPMPAPPSLLSPPQQRVCALRVVRRQHAQLSAALQGKWHEQRVETTATKSIAWSPQNYNQCVHPALATRWPHPCFTSTYLERCRPRGCAAALLELLHSRLRRRHRRHRCPHSGSRGPVLQLGVVNPLEDALARHGLRGSRAGPGRAERRAA